MSRARHDSKSERQWFVDALNAAQINQNLEGSSPPSAAVVAGVEERTRSPDFLFGLEKGHPTPAKLQDPSPVVAPTGMERHVIGEPVVEVPPAAEIQRQIHELQRMQISGHEQDLYSRKVEEFYQQKPPPQPVQPQQVAPVTTPATYWQERQGPYPAGVGVGGTEPPPVYLIQTPAGVYQAPAMRQVTGQVSQPYYGVQRIVPEAYREQPVYNPMGQPVSSSVIQQQKIGGAYTSEGIGVGLVRPPMACEPGYAQVSYDGAGRQVLYAAPGGGVNVMHAPPPYQAPPVDVRQAGGVLNPEGKFVIKSSQPS